MYKPEPFEVPAHFLPLAYHCRLCHGQFTSYYDPACPIRNIEAWRGMLTCDRCYDFRTASRSKVRAIFHACASLMNVRDGSANALPTRQTKLSAAESALQELIAKYVKELTSIYAGYFNRPNVVDPAVAEVIFAQPTQALGVILNWRDTFGHLNIAPLKPFNDKLTDGGNKTL